MPKICAFSAGKRCRLLAVFSGNLVVSPIASDCCLFLTHSFLHIVQLTALLNVGCRECFRTFFYVHVYRAIRVPHLTFFTSVSCTRKKNSLLIATSSLNLLLSDSSYFVLRDSFSKHKRYPDSRTFCLFPHQFVGTRRAQLQINRRLRVNIGGLKGWMEQCKDLCCHSISRA